MTRKSTASLPARTRKPNARLALEYLEDRLAPAVGNPSFENALTHWSMQAGGDFSTRTSLSGSSPVTPQDGSQFALLTTNATTNTGAFSSAGGAAGVEGTIAETTFTANANQNFSFKWNFVTDENVTVALNNDDFALGQLLDANGTVLQTLFSQHVKSGSGNFTQINLDPANFPRFVTGWQNASFTTTTAGTYKLRFVVSDAADATKNSGLALDAFSPGNSAPTVSLTGGSVNEASSFTLNGSIADVDHGDTHRVTIDWGDGTANTVLDLAAALNSDTTTFASSHTYADNANRTISVTVTDFFTAQGSNTTAVTVNNVDPTATLSNGGAVNEGSTGTVSFTNAADVATPDTTAGFRYSYDFDNDGTWEVGGATYAASVTATSQTVPASFLADGNGSRTVRARIYDKDNGFTQYTTTITIDNVAPTATINGPSSGTEGTAISLTSTVTDPGSPETFSYTWSVTKDGTAFGSGGTNDSFSFTPDDNGSYVVTLLVTDGDGGQVTTSKTLAVVNATPAVTINGAPTSSDEGTAISLTSTVTDAGSLDTLSYVWSVTKNGVAYGTNGTANTFSFTPDDNGIYIVTLTVTDKDGAAGSQSKTIGVNNVAPVATLVGAPSSTTEGSVFTLSSTVSDVGSADTFSYSWSVTRNGLAFTTGTGSAFNFTANDNGTYEVTLVVSDDDGGSDVETASTFVSNVNPTGVLTGPNTIDEGDSAQVSFVSLTDPSSLDAAALKFSYDFDNDGTFDLGNGTYAGSVTAATATVPANLLANGLVTRTVRATVFDKDGGSTETTFTITVNNVTPNVAAGPDKTIIIENALSGNGSFTDPGVESWTATVDYGDGTGVQALTLTGKDFVLSHQYSAIGTYTVTVRVTDGSGAIGTDTVTVTVNPVPPNVLFVRQLYLDLLSRTADVGGLTIWVNQLDSGTSRFAVAQSINQSLESLGKRVDAIYQSILNRPSDAGGRAVWVSALQAGVSDLEVKRAFFTSEEYRSTHVSDAAFITGLYTTILGRSPDAGGLASWLQNLQGGTSRAAVTQAIQTSQEGYTVSVDRLYRDYLDRALDSTGAASWIPLLQQGKLTLTEVALSILGSQEYFQHAQ